MDGSKASTFGVGSFWSQGIHLQIQKAILRPGGGSVGELQGPKDARMAKLAFLQPP